METEALDLSTLMEKLSVEYIDSPEISIELRPWTTNNSDPKQKKDSESLENHYKEAIFNQIKPKTEVRFLGSDVGYGLFAAESIKKGSYIAEYTGVVRPLAKSWFLFKRDHYPTDYAWDFPGFSKKGKSLEIDSYKKGNETRFINHSFEPNLIDNLTVIPKTNTQSERRAIFFTAIRDISKDEQLLVNYGEEYWIGGKREMVFL